jgi:fructose-1,6-bisphosphatase/inositol monophosphatase family enzyme
VYDDRASLWDLAGAVPVLLEAGGTVTGPDGALLFPIRPAGYRGEPIAFLAGDPRSHRESLDQILFEAMPASRR